MGQMNRCQYVLVEVEFLSHKFYRYSIGVDFVR